MNQSMENFKESASRSIAPSPPKYRLPLRRTPTPQAFSTSVRSPSRGSPQKLTPQSGKPSCVPSHGTATPTCKPPSAHTTPFSSFTPGNRSQTPVYPKPPPWNPSQTSLFPSAQASLSNGFAPSVDKTSEWRSPPFFASNSMLCLSPMRERNDASSTVGATGLLSGSLWRPTCRSPSSKTVHFALPTTDNLPSSSPVIPDSVTSPLQAPSVPLTNGTSRLTSSRPSAFPGTSASLSLPPKAKPVPSFRGASSTANLSCSVLSTKACVSPPRRAPPAPVPNLPDDTFSKDVASPSMVSLSPPPDFQPALFADGSLSPADQPPTAHGSSERKTQPTPFCSGNVSPKRSRLRCSPSLNRSTFPLRFLRSSSVTVPVPPTAKPSFVPSAKPSFVPSAKPSFVPSAKLSFALSANPSFVPSAKQSFVPPAITSFALSEKPSFVPSAKPSFVPSAITSFALSAKPSFVPSTPANRAPSAPTSDPHSSTTPFAMCTIRHTPVASSVPPRRSAAPSPAPPPVSTQSRMTSLHAAVDAVASLSTGTRERESSKRSPTPTHKLVLRQKRTNKERPRSLRFPLRNPRAAVNAKSPSGTQLVSATTQLESNSSSRTLSPESNPDHPPKRISLSDADNVTTVRRLLRSEIITRRTVRRASLPEVFPKAPTKHYYAFRPRALSVPRSNSTLDAQQEHTAHGTITSWTVTCNKHCHKASHHHSQDHSVPPSTVDAQSAAQSRMPIDDSSSNSNIAAAAVRRAVDYLKRPGERETVDVASLTDLSLDSSMLASARSPAEQRLSSGLLSEEDEIACSPCRNAAVNRCAQQNSGTLCAECTFMVKEAANRRMGWRSRGVQTEDTGDRTVTVRGLNGEHMSVYAGNGDTMLDMRLSLARSKGVHPSRCLLIDYDGALSPNREASNIPEVAFCAVTSLPFVFVAFGIPRPQVRKYDAESGRFLQAYTGHVRVIRDIALAVDELLLFSASEDGTCKQFNFESGRLLRTFGVGHSAIPGVLTACLVSQKAKFLCVASEAIVCRFDVASGQLLQKFTTLASMVLSLALSACERYLYVGTGGTNRSIRRFAMGDNAHTGADSKVNEEVQWASQFGTVSHMVSHIHPSKPDVECLVTASNDGNIRIYRSGNKTGLVCVKFMNFGYAVRGLAVHEDSIYVSGNRRAQRYSFDGETEQTFFLPDLAHKIAVSPCGEYLYVAMNNSVVQFSTKSGNRVDDAHRVKRCIEYPEGGATYALATF